MSQSEKLPLTVGQRAVLTGSDVLVGFAFPGMFLADKMFRGSGAIGVGIVFTLMGSVVTIPCMIVFVPARLAYDKAFDVDRLRRIERGEENV